MNRRHMLSAMIALAVPIAAPRKAYSFLWARPKGIWHAVVRNYIVDLPTGWRAVWCADGSLIVTDHTAAWNGGRSVRINMPNRVPANPYHLAFGQDSPAPLMGGV